MSGFAVLRDNSIDRDSFFLGGGWGGLICTFSNSKIISSPVST